MSDVNPVCAFPACGRVRRYKTLCAGHYQQKLRGDELKPLRMKRAAGSEVQCSFQGCDKNTNKSSKGLCRGHYNQRHLGQELTPLTRKRDVTFRDSEGLKLCGKCRAWCSPDRFNRNGLARDGLSSVCLDCCNDRGLRSKYGLTREAYDEMKAHQGGGCAICGAPESLRGTRLAVDHDHSCCPGRRSCGACVRGLLCNECNTLLGKAGDDPERLMRAARYLKSS